VTNLSQYISTNESLKKNCKAIENSNGVLPTLSKDLDYLSSALGSDLPYLPFSYADEQIRYAEYAKDNFPIDCDAAAIYWNRNIVDGIKLMPMLPIHVRTHKNLLIGLSVFETCIEGLQMSATNLLELITLHINLRN
jgi:hypothetical protein